MRHEQDMQSDASKCGVGKSPGVPLPPEAQGQIGKQLRQVYDQMLSEPMPDKFAELLARLAKSEPNS